MALASGYWTTWSTTANKSIGAVSSREILCHAHHARLRETGLVYGARFFCGDVTGLTGVFVKLWRLREGSSTAFDLVGTSSNLVAAISAGTVNDLRFATPIGGQEGDYVAIRLEGSGDGVNQLATTVLANNAQLLEVTNSTPSASGFAWFSQTATADTLLKVQLVTGSQARTKWLGYSVIEGQLGHRGFCTATTTATDVSSTSIKSSIPYRFSLLSPLPYQNMGIGSNTSADMAARAVTDVFADDVNLLVIQAGGADALTAVAASTFLTNMTTILNLAAQYKVPVCVVAPVPGSAFTDAQCVLLDAYRAGLIPLVAGYANAVYCDPSGLVGQARATGPAGNLWDMQSVFNGGDGLHYTANGHRRIAHAIHAAVRGFKLVAERG